MSAREWRIPDSARREYEEAGRRVAKRDFDGARACLQRAVKIAPRFAEAWNHLGTMAYQSQRYPESAGYFRQAVKAAPDAYEPLVNLGGVLINLGKPDEALKYNAEAVLRRPHDALAQSQLGMTYMMLNQFDPAEQHLLLACRLIQVTFQTRRSTLLTSTFAGRISIARPINLMTSSTTTPTGPTLRR